MHVLRRTLTTSLRISAVSVLLMSRAIPAVAQCDIAGTPGVPSTGDVFVGTFTPDYRIGLDTNLQRRDWLACLQDGCDGCCRMALPSGQEWGAVFITVGEPAQPPRPARDLSAFTTLRLELRGEVGGETIQIGIKDACDPDDGTEAKVTLGPLTTDWQSFDIPLSSFPKADLGTLYVVTEFVFDATVGVEIARTVSFRNVRFLNVAPPPLCGDADGNGSVTNADGVQTLRAAAGLSSVCTVDICDMNGNGNVTVSDGVQVLRASVGLSAESRCQGS